MRLSKKGTVMQFRYLIGDKRGGYEPKASDETSERISLIERSLDTNAFKGTITFKLVREDGSVAEWDEIEIQVTDQAQWESFKHGEFRLITIGEPELDSSSANPVD